MTKQLGVVLGLSLVFTAGYVLVRDGVQPSFGLPKAQAFEAPTLSGATTGPQAYPNQVVLVNFWATYCAPCVDEMPSLEQIWQDYRDEGLVVLAVSLDENAEDVAEFQKRFGITFPLAHDPDWKVANSYGTEKVPETYLVARNGEVRTKVMGAIDWASPQTRAMLEALLQES